MDNNQENKILSIEEIQKLANELDQPVLPDFNSNIDELFQTVFTKEVDLIQLNTGEYVENSNQYIRLDNYHYDNLYAHHGNVWWDEYTDSGYIVRKDSIQYILDIEDKNYVSYTHISNYGNFERIEIENIIYNIPFNCINTSVYKLETSSLIYKKVEFDKSQLTDLPYYKDLVESLDMFYPNRWDFKPASEYKFKDNPYDKDYVLMIYFPDINITNSQGHSHDIKDLYITLKFDDKGCKGHFFGTRSTRTELELRSSYTHSHLGNNSRIGYLNRFCTGTGEINLCIANLISEFSSIRFKAFLAILKPYLEWESLEGGPYIRISNISDKKVIYDTEYTGWDLRYFSEMVENNLDKLSIYTNEEGIFDIQTEDIENLFDVETIDSRMVVYKDVETLNYYSLQNSNSNNVEVDKDVLFIFKDQPIFAKIIEKKVNKDNLIKTIHPNVTKRIREQLSQRVNEYYFTKISNQ